ncbi:cytochrome P450 [Pluteus cervinus]|uniref:Cytochrome P450 n=1 Tax=Pluteus cervinus TaxID=181527 RepID=A0ACD3ALX1_9AGAR|nr:cytochrome P450 [Pluteus cervinus]
MTFSFSALSCIYIFALVLAAKAFLSPVKRKDRRFPRPPGPKPLPVIGNLLDVPTDMPWLGYDEWFRKYGDIVSIEVLGQPIVLLGSLKRTSDLFDKRSSIYSDRVRMPMINELMGWDFSLAFMPYGHQWRRHRRMFNSHFNITASARYKPIHLQETQFLLGRLLESPDDFLHHVRHTFSATIMNSVYGIVIQESNDPYISTAEECLQGLAEAGVAGSFLVDLLPVLKYVPSWVPGAGFQRKATSWKMLNKQLVDKPFNAVKERLGQGKAKDCAVVKMLETVASDHQGLDEERTARNCAAVAYAGGADTTVSSAQTFFLAMALYPEVQKQAQAEIDAVVGNQRLPDFSDRDSLPYINAIVKETMRWQNVTPLSVAHATTEDDVYDGYFIPKGSIVIGSTWSIMHDPEAYPEPHEFRPERFLKDGKLNSDIRDPHVAAFGFGRRLCPGRWFSDNSLFTVVSCVTAVYDITRKADADGNVLPLEPGMTSGLLSYPVPFECTIKPRSKAAEALVRESQGVNET